MKVSTKRFLIELAATGVASPLLLILMLRIGAFNGLALLAYPTLPLLRVVSPLFLGMLPTQGGWFPTLGAAAAAECFILPVWTWILLMILVKFSETSIKLLGKYKHERDPA